MKKSKKLSFFYISSSIISFLVLIAGGLYGLYLSVGITYVRSSISTITNTSSGGISPVGNNVINNSASTTGIIFLSGLLLLLAILDLISLIKQIIFFKQYKIIRESKLEKKIEKKVKSKGSVIAYAGTIDFLSIVVGVAGIIINSSSYVNGNLIWVLYAIDIAVVLFSLLSFILLIVKVKQSNKIQQQEQLELKEDIESKTHQSEEKKMTLSEINEIENDLIKLKYLKENEVISEEEYDSMRKMLFPKLKYAKKKITRTK